MLYKRQIEDSIKENLFQGQIIAIFGARQVGKTTLAKKILDDLHDVPSRYINCDEGDYRRLLNRADTSTTLKEIIGDNKLIVIDEAQRIKNIGLKLKLLIDTFPKQQIIATGSSSFELGQDIFEPLTGRVIEFWLYPLSLSEISGEMNNIELKRQLESLLIFGSYPAVVTAPSREKKQLTINTIAEKYLYKDVLELNGIRGTDTVRKLLEALALQAGSEVSFNELSRLLGMSKQTVEHYIEILEKAFVIFRLRPFSRNLRKELSKLRKIFFYDTGIRNSLINNQNPLSLRNDIGALWENFIISERKKQQLHVGKKINLYFWRTYDQQEIDLVEEKGGKLTGYEIKWKTARAKIPKAWKDTYPQASWQIINHDNFLKILT